MESRKKTVNYSVPAAEAMLTIVEFLAEQPHACGVSELARNLNLSTNLTFRIMKCLMERGYVEADASMAYQLPPRWLNITSAVARRYDLIRKSREFLEQLSRETGLIAMLQIRAGERMLVTNAVPPERPFYLQVTTGVYLKMDHNAFGKIYRIYAPRSGRETLPESLLDFGCAWDWEEYTPGVFCVAAPVYGAGSEVVGALGVSGLIAHLDHKDKEHLATAVRNQAESLIEK